MRRTRHDEPFEEDDRDAPIASDQHAGGEGSDDFDVVPCPYCRKSISDLAEVCPHCRSFISRADLLDDDAGRPLWVKVTLIILIASLVLGAISFR